MPVIQEWVRCWLVTVVPDPKKDIGFTLMEPFHYGGHVKVTTCKTLADAVQSLAA